LSVAKAPTVNNSKSDLIFLEKLNSMHFKSGSVFYAKFLVAEALNIKMEFGVLTREEY
jgi:hypothetical protein